MIWGDNHEHAIAYIGPWRIAFAVVMFVAYLTSGLWLPMVDAALVARQQALIERDR